jgi:hypothetical protein
MSTSPIFSRPRPASLMSAHTQGIAGGALRQHAGASAPAKRPRAPGYCRGPADAAARVVLAERAIEGLRPDPRVAKRFVDVTMRRPAASARSIGMFRLPTEAGSQSGISVYGSTKSWASAPAKPTLLLFPNGNKTRVTGHDDGLI